mgnify:CR=1 FL=1
MGFINAIISLVSNPRAAIASGITASPFTVFGLIFLVIVKYTRLKSCASFGGKHNRRA